MLNSVSALTMVWYPKPISTPVDVVTIPSRPMVLPKKTSVARAMTSSGTMMLVYVRPSNGSRNHSRGPLQAEGGHRPDQRGQDGGRQARRSTLLSR